MSKTLAAMLLAVVFAGGMASSASAYPYHWR